MLQPEQTEAYIKWLVEAGLLDEAATRLAVTTQPCRASA